MNVKIKQSQLKYLRRLRIIDDIIWYSLYNYDSWHKGFNQIINHLVNDVAEQYFFRFSEDFYVGGDEYDDLQEFLEVYLFKEWKDRIQNIKYGKQRG